MSTEMMWLSLAPVSNIAEKFYQVDSLRITLFAMSYMIMFIIFSIPASIVIDELGYRRSLIIGALLTSIFGLTRAIFADSYIIALGSQFLIAVGQPFLLNISTKVAANWFPQNERSTATGILTMAQYVGFTIPMLLSPFIVQKFGIPSMFMLYAIISIVSAILAIFLTKEKPKVVPPGPLYEKEELNLNNFKKLFLNKNFMVVLLFCFLSIGVFNTILSLIETILAPRGITATQAGIVGALFTAAGVIGAVIIPLISDKLQVRKPLWVVASLLLVPVYSIFTVSGSFKLIAVDAAIAGFFIMGVAPIVFQYGAEVAYPAQEGTSLGLMLLGGQCSGILFVYVFETVKALSNSTNVSMIMLIIVTIIQIPLSLLMKENTVKKVKEFSESKSY
jgi:FLVCR family MFS transporter 7